MVPLAMLMISGLLMVTFVAAVAITLVSATLAIFVATPTLSGVVVATIRNPQTTGQRGDQHPHGGIDNRAHDVLLTTWPYNEAMTQAEACVACRVDERSLPTLR